MTRWKYRALGALLVAAGCGGAAVPVDAARSPLTATDPQLIDDSTMKATTTTMGGASVLPTTRTVAHWHGQALDPHDGVTYGYNMVGADPGACAGSGCSVTIEADITPIVVTLGGRTFSGDDVVGATLASPVFALDDYGATAAATAAGSFPVAPAFVRGAGGVLSQGDAGNPLQLEDATMRAQFDQTGASPYHLILHPNVSAPVVIDVPQNQGVLRVTRRGVVFADVNINWWSAQIQNLEQAADPTHLPIYLTNNVFLFEGTSPDNCCVLGYHGTRASGNGGGSTNSNGNAVVQTFAWASWVQPGTYARPAGGTDWALQDIHALSHEIAEWADDPFVDNLIEPWLTPTAPQYGCTNVIETGDPVVGIGFAMGTNTYQQGANPDGTQSADGAYHPEDEVFLPWFTRTAPNGVSEPTQSGGDGRYTMMGDLNPFPGFRTVATGCN